MKIYIIKSKECARIANGKFHEAREHIYGIYLEKQIAEAIAEVLREKEGIDVYVDEKGE